MSRGNHKKDCEVEAVALPSIVPAGTPDWITLELIERTIKVWQPYYEQVLSAEEAVTMIRNAGRLFVALSSENTAKTICCLNLWLSHIHSHSEHLPL